MKRNSSKSNSKNSNSSRQYQQQRPSAIAAILAIGRTVKEYLAGWILPGTKPCLVAVSLAAVADGAIAVAVLLQVLL